MLQYLVTHCKQQYISKDFFNLVRVKSKIMSLFFLNKYWETFRIMHRTLSPEVRSLHFIVSPPSYFAQVVLVLLQQRNRVTRTNSLSRYGCIV